MALMYVHVHVHVHERFVTIVSKAPARGEERRIEEYKVTL